MKRKIAAVLVVLAAVICLASCNGTQQIDSSSFEKLPAPADIAVQFNRITWESVDGCVGYAVDYNGEITEVSDAFYESSYRPYYDDLTIKVKALGDNVYYEDSDWAEYVIEYEQPTEGLRYTLVEGGWGYEVTRPDENDVNKGLEGRVVIPDFYNDLPVVRIAESMFCRKVINGYIYNDVTTSVRFPRFLEQIGSDAFRGLQKLTSISLPENVANYSSFCDCVNLSWVDLPSDAVLVQSMFENCTSLRMLELPNGITEIPAYTFKNCKNLLDVRIPGNVTTIWDEAFSGCESFVTIVVPDSVTEIRGYAFKICANLEKVYLSKSLITLGSGAFSGCEKLNEVELPESLVSIGSSAFASCSSVESIVIPDNVTEIGSNAFAGAYALKDIKFGKGVKKIGGFAFIGTEWLADRFAENPGFLTVNNVLVAYLGEGDEITSLPDEVEYVAPGAFTAALGAEGNFLDYEYWHDIEGSVENGAYIQNYGIRKIDLSRVSGVEFGGRLFYSCPQLEYVALPESITRLDDGDFVNCTALKTLVLPASLEYVGTTVFPSLLFNHQFFLSLEVYFAGTREQWEEVDFAYPNVKSALNVRFYSELPPETDAEMYWRYDSDGSTLLSWAD